MKKKKKEAGCLVGPPLPSPSLQSQPYHHYPPPPFRGWPTFSGDSTLFFHRKEDDGWWSIFHLDLTDGGKLPDLITPPGVHAFTDGGKLPDLDWQHITAKWIAVAMRRKETKYRHIEIFNLETEEFIQVTEIINRNLHHYNPFLSPENPNLHHYNLFLSPESTHLGYHRFRGDGDTTMRYATPIRSPAEHLKMIRTPMSFPFFLSQRRVHRSHRRFPHDSWVDDPQIGRFQEMDADERFGGLLYGVEPERRRRNLRVNGAHFPAQQNNGSNRAGLLRSRRRGCSSHHSEAAHEIGGRERCGWRRR